MVCVFGFNLRGFTWGRIRRSQEKGRGSGVECLGGYELYCSIIVLWEGASYCILFLFDSLLPKKDFVLKNSNSYKKCIFVRKPYDEGGELKFIWSVCRKITEIEILECFGKQIKI